MDFEIRPIATEEFEAFAIADGSAFGFDINPDQLDDLRPIFEFDRSLATFDGPEIVSTTGIFSFDLTVPGGALPTAGVTWVSVKPTHRRRGLLAGMMRQQLSDVRDKGEPLAALWASESIIYRRFGYGLAAEGVEVKIDRQRTTFEHKTPACGRTRLLSREEALSTWPSVYDKALASQPGMYSRSEAWWKHHTLGARERSRSGFSGRFYVQYEEEKRPLGYARYRIKGDDRDGSPDGLLAIQELIATTDAAYAALWQYLFGVDLVSTITARWRPVNEPLLWMLDDPRRFVRRPQDALWLRLVDIPAALEGRRYAEEGRLVLDVRDKFCAWNEGRYELEAGPDGACCRLSDAEPDIVLDVADLGAVYLGGARLQTLRSAGRVEGDWETLRRADAIFSWHPLPWCPEVF